MFLLALYFELCPRNLLNWENGIKNFSYQGRWVQKVWFLTSLMNNELKSAWCRKYDLASKKYSFEDWYTMYKESRLGNVRAKEVRKHRFLNPKEAYSRLSNLWWGSQQRFWAYRETWLIKTIPMILHNLCVSFKSQYLLWIRINLLLSPIPH